MPHDLALHQSHILSYVCRQIANAFQMAGIDKCMRRSTWSGCFRISSCIRTCIALLS